ncbi:MAG: lysylphosphatidylglycerol synthase transmembrane domain-containing protein [Desulfurobacteriaceae bacterium]
MKKSGSLTVSFLILLIFIYFLYEYRVFSNLEQIVSNLDPLYLFISLLLYVSTYLFRAKRFTVMFPQISTKDLTAVMAVHTFFNNVFPFRSGEASFPIILKKFFGVELSISSGALLFARLLDLMSLSFLFLVSSLVVASHERKLLLIPLVSILAVILVLVLALKLLKMLRNRFFVIGALFYFFNQFVSTRKLSLIALYSLLTWLFKFSSFYFILRAAGVNLNFFQTVFVSTFGEITTVLPVHSIGGFGTYEAGLVGGFKLLGVKTSYALTVAFYFHVILLVMSGLLALAGWVYLQFRLRRVYR